MEALAQASGARAAGLAADMALTTLYATPTPVFDATRGRELAERTIALARELGDRSAESKALWNLMILNVFSGGDPDEAVDAGERSLAIARELNAREQIAFTLNDLWRPYAAIGDLRAARACLEEARPLWREMGNLPMLCENLSSTSALLGLAGEYDEALALCDEAYAIAGEIGNPWGQSYSLLNAYHIDVDRGNVGRAMDRMRECIQLSELAGFVLPQAITRAELGALYASLGRSRARHGAGGRGARGREGAEPTGGADGDGVEGRDPAARGRARRGRGHDRPQRCRAAPRADPLHRRRPRRAHPGAARVGQGRARPSRRDRRHDARVAPPARRSSVPPGRAPVEGQRTAGQRPAREAEEALLEARSEAERLGFGRSCGGSTRR